jgi:thiamine biosynthesis lipoprotein
MGTEVVVGGAKPDELAAVKRLFAKWDRIFSRFRPESELSRVNASGAEFVAVSPTFASVLAVALDAAARTDGLVDPTLGLAIEAAGYDRDFARLTPNARPPAATAPGSWRTVRLAGRLLFRVPGMKLDLNCVAKGLAVDDSLDLLAGDGFVSAGGDVAARDSVAVGLPGGGSITLRHGGLATSGTTGRRWVRGCEEQHHLIDPRTGRPSNSRWAEVTVAAPTCVAADIAAKTAFLLSDEGPAWLDAGDLPGRFSDGASVLENKCWRRSLALATAA